MSSLKQEKINEINDAHEVGKVENWRNINQKIVIKHNFNNNGAIVLKTLHD
jgi:hypothetical protein